jgi:hypothetical protein
MHQASPWYFEPARAEIDRFKPSSLVSSAMPVLITKGLQFPVEAV